MILKRATLPLFVLTSLSWAFAPAFFYLDERLVDRAFEASKSDEVGQIALQLLERVAEGRAATLDPRGGARLGFSAAEIQRSGLRDPTVRAYALRMIGESDRPEALSYLTSLQRFDLEDDNSQQVWRAAMVALRIARVNRIADPQSKIEFLESAIQETGGHGPVGLWAIDELCDRGSQSSLPLLRQTILNLHMTTKEDHLRFCEARIEAVSRDPDRVKALTSILRVDESLGDARLQAWVMNQLAPLRVAEVDRKLEQYAAEIERLPEDSQEKTRLSTLAHAIRVALSEYPRRPANHRIP